MDQANSNAILCGKRLRELRGIRTRRGVCRELGIGYSSLQSYEEGRRNPSEKVKDLLADYYGVSKETIFFTHENPKK